jgi:two-component system NtrC family sensor kinase
MGSVPQFGTNSILVIEDEPSVMSYIKLALERHGFRVTSTETGVEALELLKNGQFIGILSDMRTPGGVDGAGVHAWVAENRPDLANRMVFITGDTVNEETAATLSRTGVPFIEKPFRISQLLEVIERTMSRAT